ncbi:hypothetical protein N8T08_010655 [Aspergillus melleus]|uniref:Uncharacterized protein n=1 Tax=Aspergillus melleus TaxID=138277 RepID=A0ACC3BBX4_9EURO|nr:hypothetical protein N8T08_010655 [Aspergillus melleus]
MEDSKQAAFTDCRRVVSPSSVVYSPRRHVARSIALALLALVVSIWWLFPPHIYEIQSPSEPAEEEFNWSECARLEVPMDYNRPDGKGRRVAVAVTRLPARVPVTDPRYGGPILINPGGPGGSGVAQVLRTGRNFQIIVDAGIDPTTEHEPERSRNQYFDIIGFDPRGVNNTTPGFGCFPNLFSQKNWELQAEAEGMLSSSGDAFVRNWQRTLALNTGCSARLSTVPEGEQEALGEHVNTPPVARDMLEIIERHAEWRELQGQAEQARRDRLYGSDREQAIVRRTKWNRGQEKLLYWGRSYGTILGSTFANMFPERMGRAVLDGVVDIDKYYQNKGHNSIIDADQIFDQFAHYCATAGAERCPFYREGGEAAIKQAYRALEDKLYNASVPVPASETRGPEIITWTDLKLSLRIAMYQPLVGFPLLARHARSLSDGDGSEVADFKQKGRQPSCPSTQCLLDGPWSISCQPSGANEAYASVAVLCTDAEYLQAMDEERFLQDWKILREDSVMLGDYWAHIGLGCVGWNVKAKWRVPGSYFADLSHPLLFVSNLLDPVTPLRSAENMVKKFPGSVLLRQDSEGHSTLSAPSLCINKAIRKYFQTGELPPPDTLCEGDLVPFLGAPGGAHDMTIEDQELWDAILDDARDIQSRSTPL